jgi:hypothetical protein
MTPINIQSNLGSDPTFLASELLTMDGVNHELMPLVKMTAPRSWRQKPLPEWPVENRLFTRVILLLGIIPVDLHRFGLLSTGRHGFLESSTSLVMKTWRHERIIEKIEGGARVADRVEFQPRLAVLGAILQPIYRQVFEHRHKRLRKRYGVCVSENR